MKIALIGYGAMGKLIAALAEGRGHEVAVIVDERAETRVSTSGPPASSDTLVTTHVSARVLHGCDVAVDFSTADAVVKNVSGSVAAGVPIVVGTTGWNDQRAEIERIVLANNGAMVFGANFSIGVNLFYKISLYAAALFAKFPEYEAFIEEQHHSRKLDSPSGTALKLKDIVERQLSTAGTRTSLSACISSSLHADEDVRVPVSSTRAGNIPGTHRVGFDGAADQILLEHTARSREGFANGAILAAEWIVGKQGFYEFTDVMDEIIGLDAEARL